MQIQKAERRLIFETKRKMNDFTADDMRHGDMTKEKILQQGNHKMFTQFNFEKTIDEHFDNISSMAEWTAWGKYSPLINIMIEKFKKDDGGILRHNLLNKAFLGHTTTIDCVNKIKGFLSDLLSNNDFCSLSIDDLQKLNLKIRDPKDGIKLPKFDNYDWFNGLGITIHDTYATKIYLDYIDIKDNGFEASLSFKI